MKRLVSLILVALMLVMAVTPVFAGEACGICGGNTIAKYTNVHQTGSMYHTYGKKYDPATHRYRPVIYYNYPMQRTVTLTCTRNKNHKASFTQNYIKQDYCWNE